MQEFDEISIFKHLNFQKSQLGIKKSQFQKMPFSKISIFKKNCNFQKSQFKKKDLSKKYFLATHLFLKICFTPSRFHWIIRICLVSRHFIRVDLIPELSKLAKPELSHLSSELRIASISEVLELFHWKAELCESSAFIWC